MDDGLGGSFVKVANGLVSSYIIKNGIVAGRSYRVRYRARNVVGYGQYSDVLIVSGSSKPDKMEAPVFF